MKSVMFLPVFNQIQELPRLLDELAATDLPVDTLLFVNNGSSDGSELLVRKSGHPCLEVERNQGIGFSIILAQQWALDHGYEVFGTMAANGKMLPSEMHRVVGPVVRNEADYVTGSRFLLGGSSPNLPLFRKLAIPAVNLAVWPAVGHLLTDATCGYRAYRTEILRRATFDWASPDLHTYGAEYYLYAKVLRSARWRVREVPVTMRYPSAGRYSKIRPGQDWWAMVRPFFKARLEGSSFD